MSYRTRGRISIRLREGGMEPYRGLLGGWGGAVGLGRVVEALRRGAGGLGRRCGGLGL